MEITERSNKQEIVDEAVVLIYELDEEISQARQERTVLWVLVGLLAITTVLF